MQNIFRDLSKVTIRKINMSIDSKGVAFKSLTDDQVPSTSADESGKHDRPQIVKDY